MSVPIPYAFFQSDDGTGFVLQALGSQGDGALVFTQLQDAPASYTGHGSKFLKVKSAADGVEFVAATIPAFTQLSDVPASYAGHGSKIVTVNGAANGLEFVAPVAPVALPQVTIEDVTLGADSSTISFASIPQTYNHLRLELFARSNNATQGNIYLRVNSDTDSDNYHTQTTDANLTTLFTNDLTGHAGVFIGSFPANDISSTHGGVSSVRIPFYKSDKTKLVFSDNAYSTSGGDVINRQLAGVWIGLPEISSLTITVAGGQGPMYAGSRAILYGLL